MSIARSHPAGWVAGLLPLGDLNALDTVFTRALDKRAGNTESLASVVTLTGAGRIATSTAVGADADTTYQVGGGANVVRVSSAVTANRVYALSAVGTQTGDVVTFFCDPNFAFEVTITASSQVFVLGNTDDADGRFASFAYGPTGWLAPTRGTMRSVAFTTPSDFTWTCPPGVTDVIVFGSGGGGGGGASLGANDVLFSTGLYCNGAGGGGGGAIPSCTMLSGLTPGESVTVHVGAGGVGGVFVAASDIVAGGRASAGARGDQSKVTGQSSGVFCQLNGAGGGGGGILSLANTTSFALGVIPGGSPTAPAAIGADVIQFPASGVATLSVPWGTTGSAVPGINITPGQGGGSPSGTNPVRPGNPGAPNIIGNGTPGAGGRHGNTTYAVWGAGGGGGGAGFTGQAGAGGAGGDSRKMPTDMVGAFATRTDIGRGDAGANASGFGGGGGGAGAAAGFDTGLASQRDGQNGGAGAPGFVVILYVK
jgi:hypothetical protein